MVVGDIDFSLSFSISRHPGGTIDVYIDVVSMIGQDETLQPTTVQNDVKTGIETALSGNALYPAVNSYLNVYLPQLGTERVYFRVNSFQIQQTLFEIGDIRILLCSL